MCSKTIQRGFTLIELIMVIVILGVLAVFAAPMFNATMFNARGFHDETLSLLRHAQKSAIAQRRTVCVTLKDTGVTSKIYSATPEAGTGNCTSATDLAPPNTLKGGKGLTAKVNGAAVTFPFQFQFSPLGNTNQSESIVISISDSTDITVETGTGYVHD
jgi:MSHA pilin protein MshC